MTSMEKVCLRDGIKIRENGQTFMMSFKTSMSHNVKLSLKRCHYIQLLIIIYY